MELSQLQNRRYKIFFFLINIIIYLIVFISLNWLQFTPKSDEPHYWKTTLLFAKSLIPDLNLLKNYGELNTPLPFIIFGNLERIFKGGIFAGRLLNMILSFWITCIIGFAQPEHRKSSVLAICGLLLCPYYFRLSTYFYTDIIATFFVFLGFVFYIRSFNIISSIAFILAIASRQYMLVFPVSILAFELFDVFKNQLYILRKRNKHHIKDSQLKNKNHNQIENNIFSTRLVMPLIASLSILGWFIFFNGIAPQAGLARTNTPEVQQSLFSVAPDSSLYFLACVGLYFAIPELCLFYTRLLFSPHINAPKLLTLKNFSLAFILLMLFMIFPPLQSHGLLTNIGQILPNNFLMLTLYYVLALIGIVRFSHRIDIAFWILLVNCTLMMKAFPWDKYVLPLLVVFWYLKSIHCLHQETPHNLTCPKYSQI
ncbi:hypothetical protein [Rivularia sp. PCC 7116]|uniref:hypothetical protein n=1 Tax=Rivularia sp. PCC 7116 TaxID=373994 RepID=UPI0012FA9688|nr:hypothetical protein [Rivularia sp. PCC 7116]